MNNTPIVPKSANGTLQVAFNGRVSTDKQDIGNIEASFVSLQQLVNEYFTGQVSVQRYGEQSSGLDIGRQEMQRLLKQIKTGTLDLLLSEDLGRFYRDPSALWQLLDLCEKHRVRLICPGDDLDTANEHWRKTAHTAIANHCGFLDDTRRRIKRTTSKRFPEGGIVIHETPGYRKLTRAEAAARPDAPGLQLMLIESHRPVINDVLHKVVVEGYSYARVADHLNSIGLKPSSDVKSGVWTGPLVKTWLRNPLLAGWRQYSLNKHGRDPVTKDKTITPNPAPLRKYYEVLAFLTEDQFGELQKVLDGNINGQLIGSASGATQRRRGVPRRDTLFPRQQLACKICGGLYYDAAVKSMRCCNSLRRSRTPCWCRMQIQVAVIVAVLIDFLLGILKSAPLCVMERFMTGAFQMLHNLQANYLNEIEVLRKEIDVYRAALNNLYACAEKAGQDEARNALMTRIEAKLVQIRDAGERIGAIEAAARAEGRAQSVQDLQLDPRSALLDLAANSFEFGALLRRIMPKVFVHPIQAIDSGLLRPRLEIELDLSSFNHDGGEPVAVEFHTIDGFVPAQPFRDREHAVSSRDKLLADGLPAGAAAVSRVLGIGKTRVSRAA